MLRLIAVFSIFIMSSGYVNHSFAEENASTDITMAQNKALRGKVSGLLKTLAQDEASHFMIMYSNYTIYSMVKAVSHDVEGAVTGCAENNKEMAGDINTRFKKWENSIGNNLKEVDASIKNLSLSQTYVPQSELKMIFGLVDEVRSVNSSRFETTPVTTTEACEFMLSKMDETEDSMNRMLKAALLSYPNTLKKMQK